MSPGYLTDLPSRRLPGAKLHEAIRLAREQIAVRGGGGGLVKWRLRKGDRCVELVAGCGNLVMWCLFLVSGGYIRGLSVVDVLRRGCSTTWCWHGSGCCLPDAASHKYSIRQTLVSQAAA